RVDFLLRGDEVYLSEINTIPGFTPISLFPTMPAEAGLDFTAVCLRVPDLAPTSGRRTCPVEGPPRSSPVDPPGDPGARRGPPDAARRRAQPAPRRGTAGDAH